MYIINMPTNSEWSIFSQSTFTTMATARNVEFISDECDPENLYSSNKFLQIKRRR
jgi:hypothetical protein